MNEYTVGSRVLTQVKARDFFGYLGAFLMVWPMFMFSLDYICCPGKSTILFLFAGLICLVYATGSKYVIRGSIPMLAMLGALLLVYFWNNVEIRERDYRPVGNYAGLLLMAMSLYKERCWWKYFWKVCGYFAMFHLVTGVFLLVFKGVLNSVVVPLFRVDREIIRQLRLVINQNYMTGLTYHYSTMGTYMALGVVVYSDVVYNVAKREAKKNWLPFLMMLAGLILTGKRGPSLFIAISILITYWLANRPFTVRQYVYTAFFGVLGILALLIMYFTIPQFKTLLMRFLLDSGEGNDMSNGRTEYFWWYELWMIQQKPWMGWGWRSFRRMAVTDFGHVIPNDGHNIYLQLLAETGIVGFAVFMIFFAANLIIVIRAVSMNNKQKLLNEGEYPYLQLSLCYQMFFLMYGMTGNPLYNTYCYIPYYISCMIGYSAMYTMKKQMRNDRQKAAQEEAKAVQLQLGYLQ